MPSLTIPIGDHQADVKLSQMHGDPNTYQVFIDKYVHDLPDNVWDGNLKRPARLVPKMPIFSLSFLAQAARPYSQGQQFFLFPH